jgi:hypothetical protein
MLMNLEAAILVTIRSLTQLGMFSRLVVRQWGMFSRLVVRQLGMFSRLVVRQ